MAIVCTMVALGLLWGKEAVTFLGPARNGLSEQVRVAPGSGVVTASTRSATASFSQPRPIGGARAGTPATDVFGALSLFAVACGVHRMAASCSTKKLKHRSCTVACQAGEVPTPVIFQPCIRVSQEPTSVFSQPHVSLEDDLTITPTTMAPPSMSSQIAEPRTDAGRAAMVGGARCAPTRAASRHARQRKAANGAAASRAARRAMGSRLQAATCHQEPPPLSFDASRQRLKIQAGLRLTNRMRSGHVREIRSPAGSVENLNGLFTTYFYMMGNLAYSKNLACATVREVVSDFATRVASTNTLLTTPLTG